MFSLLKLGFLALMAIKLSSSTILQNGQVRPTNFPNTLVTTSASNWKTYSADATELSYKGRWDSKYISWWSAPGLKFGFTGNEVSISFGNYTSDGVLVAYRVDGLDWQLTNVTANAVHLLVSPALNPGIFASTKKTFELRVTNYAYGVQIQSVHVATDAAIYKIPDFSRRIEMIGDSLTSGYSATYEGISSFGYGLAAGLGDTEYSITAYPGICVHDQNCFGNPRGHTYQWYQTSDTSPRARELYGSTPETWDFKKHPAADLVIINLGTNDNNSANNVGTEKYYASYVELVEGVHKTWPKAEIVIMSLWNGFSQSGTTYSQVGAYTEEIYNVYKHFSGKNYLRSAGIRDPFIHYFNSTGILQHNDIDPQYHPTDVGHIKVASHLMQFVKNTFDWDFAATGPEIQHETLYWNDEVDY